MVYGYAQSHMITVPSTATTYTANYKTQYYLTTSTNFGSVSPASGWYNAGSTVTISATAPTAGSGEQYVWNGWTGTGTVSCTGINNPATNAVTMNGPVTEDVSWTHQYYLTVSTNPAEVQTLNANAVSGQGWYDSGTTATVDAVQLVEKAAGSSRYDFRSWAGATPTTGNKANVLMDAAKTATATYQLQFKLTILTDPSGLSPAPSAVPASLMGSMMMRR